MNRTIEQNEKRLAELRGRLENRESLGNFPQAYAHLGLITAAVRLSELGWRPEPIG